LIGIQGVRFLLQAQLAQLRNPIGSGFRIFHRKRNLSKSYVGGQRLSIPYFNV
jgi:hypothetical protein